MTAIEPGIAPVFIGEENPRCSTRWWDEDDLQFECGADATHLVHAHSNTGGEHYTAIEPMCERCLNEALLLECQQHQMKVVISWALL